MLFRSLSLDDLVVDETSIAEVRNQVYYLLNEWKPLSAGDLQTLLDGVSGLLCDEFKALEKQLLLHPEWVSTALIDHLEARFEQSHRQFAYRIAQLRSLIRPPKPEQPDPAWDVEGMLDWATQRYLPYQSWCDLNEQFDPELYQMGDRFSEWLARRATIRFHGE